MSLALALAVATSVPGVDVVWRGPPECPEQGFWDDLARYLGGSGAGREVAVDVAVERETDGRWSARLDLAAAGTHRARTLRGRSCAELRDAIAFVTAIAVDPGVLAGPAPEAVTDPGDADPVAGEVAVPDAGSVPPPPPARDPEPDASLAASVRPESPATASPPSTPPPPRARPRGFVRLAGGLEALGLPHVGPQAALAAGALGRHWRVEATALYRGPTTQASAVAPTAGARVRLWAVGARGCGVPRVGPVELPLCAGVEVGQALGEGVGYVGARRDGFVWAAAVLGAAAAWAPWRRLALWIGADLGLPLRRGTFGATGLGTMFEIAPVSLRAAAGLELRLGRG